MLVLLVLLLLPLALSAPVSFYSINYVTGHGVSASLSIYEFPSLTLLRTLRANALGRATADFAPGTSLFAVAKASGQRV